MQHLALLVAASLLLPTLQKQASSMWASPLRGRLSTSCMLQVGSFSINGVGTVKACCRSVFDSCLLSRFPALRAGSAGHLHEFRRGQAEPFDERPHAAGRIADSHSGHRNRDGPGRPEAGTDAKERGSFQDLLCTLRYATPADASKLAGMSKLFWSQKSSYPKRRRQHRLPSAIQPLQRKMHHGLTFTYIVLL